MIATIASRRLASASLIAAAFAIGTTQVAHAAVELDVQQYDDCVHAAFSKYHGITPYGNNVLAGALEQCCTEAGGINKITDTQFRCEAPPEEANPNDASTHPTPPPRVVAIPHPGDQQQLT